MFLTDPQLSTLLSTFAPSQLSKRSVTPGTVLQSEQSSNEICIVVSGYCRILDPSSRFGSLTLLRAQSPYVCGALHLLDETLHEEVVASTECTVIVISPPYDVHTVDFFKDLFFQSVSPSELPFIQSVVISSSLNIPEEQQSPPSYLRNWCIATPEDISNATSDSLFVYADKSSKGFSYGQIITLTTLKQFFLDSLPRLLVWSDQRDSIFKPTAIVSSDSDASSPHLSTALLMPVNRFRSG